MFDEVREDVRYGWRLIRKHPLLSCALVATLSLGIGLDAGVFTLINGMLFFAAPKPFWIVSPMPINCLSPFVTQR